ncbi:hypothetical protein D1872_81090 [compost metagenome]
MPKIVRKTYTKTQAENDQLELARLKEQIKVLTKREEELKNRLASYMEKNFQPDSKGHYLFTVIDANGKPIHLQRQARKKISINNEVAIPWLKKKHKEAIIPVEKIADDVTQDQIIEALANSGYDEFIDVEERVDEDYLAQLISEGTLSMSDFEKLCKIDVSYAMTYISDEKLQEYLQKGSADDAAKENR